MVDTNQHITAHEAAAKIISFIMSLLDVKDYGEKQLDYLK